MAITVTDAWKAAVRKRNARIRYLAIIEDGTNTWYALDGSSDTLSAATYPVGLAGPPSSVGAEIDPLTRNFSIEQVVVNFRDAYLRPIHVSNRLKGQSLTVKIGAAELGSGDYCYYGSGVISDILGDGEKKIITVETKTPFTMLNEEKVVGAWYDVHPLEVLYKGDGSGVIELCGVPTSLVDTSSFDPSNYTGSISHWTVLRDGIEEGLEIVGDVYQSTGWGSGEHIVATRTIQTGADEFTLLNPTPGIDIVRHFATLLNGTVKLNGDGKLTFSLFDSTAAITGTWDDSHIISCRPIEEKTKIINRVIADFWEIDSTIQYEDNDSDSQTAHAYKGGDPRVFNYQFRTDWCNARAYLGNGAGGDLPNDTDTSMTISHTNTFAFTGARQALAGGGQPAECALSAARKAYYYIGNWDKREIVAVTDATASTSKATLIHYHTPGGDGGYTYAGPLTNEMVLNTVVRGQLDTTAIDWSAEDWPVLVWDITMLVYFAGKIVDRFGSGIDIIELVTGMGELDKELGELMGIVDDDFVSYGIDGLDGTSQKYEIIRREPTPENNTVTWLLATADVGSPTHSYGSRTKGTKGVFERHEAVAAKDVVRQHVLSGLLSSTDAGFDGLISAGVVSTHPDKRHNTIEQPITYSANKDTYVTYSGMTRKFGVYPVANAAAQPTIADNEFFVAKVVTDGAGITGHTDMRETMAIDSLDKVDDGSTYLRVAGVSSGHQIQAASIATDAVIEAKIQNGSVTENKIGALAVSSGKIASGAVIAGKIASGGVSASSQIADSTVAVQNINRTASISGRVMNLNRFGTLRSRG